MALDGISPEIVRFQDWNAMDERTVLVAIHSPHGKAFLPG